MGAWIGAAWDVKARLTNGGFMRTANLFSDRLLPQSGQSLRRRPKPEVGAADCAASEEPRITLQLNSHLIVICQSLSILSLGHLHSSVLKIRETIET